MLRPHDLAPHETAEHDQSTRVLSAGTAPAVSPSEPVERAASGIVCQADLVREDLTGLSIGPYELGRRIGGGGMGAVYLARHGRLGKTFAVKFITGSIAAFAEGQSRFEQEVRALGKLQHPNIVSAVDAGRCGGLQFLVTELVEGEDFAQIVERRGPIEVPEACELIRQAANGLQFSHNARFVHRDVKPSNLILDRNGIVKILDFGLVRHTVDEDRLTHHGDMLGTWDFVPPEQAHDARSSDERGDVYGLGCTLLYLLSGRVPFGEERYSTAAAKLKGHLFDRAAWFDRVPAHVPRELAAFLERMLAKSAADRVQTAAEVAVEMTRYAPGAELGKLWGAANGSPVARLADVAGLQESRNKPNFKLSRGVLNSLVASAAMLITLAAAIVVVFGTGSPRNEIPSSTNATNVTVSPPAPEAEEALSPEIKAEPRSAKVFTSDPKRTLNASAPRVSLPGTSPARSPLARGSVVE